VNSPKATFPPSLAQAQCGHNALIARDLTLIAPELGRPFLQINVPRSLFDTRPKRKPQPKSQNTLIKTAKRNDLSIKRLNPDGSVEIGKVEVTKDKITVEIGAGDGGARDASVVAMDRIAAMRRGTR
jgi:hypothetical protein